MWMVCGNFAGLFYSLCVRVLSVCVFVCVFGSQPTTHRIASLCVTCHLAPDRSVARSSSTDLLSAFMTSLWANDRRSKSSAAVVVVVVVSSLRICILPLVPFPALTLVVMWCFCLWALPHSSPTSASDIVVVLFRFVRLLSINKVPTPTRTTTNSKFENKHRSLSLFFFSSLVGIQCVAPFPSCSVPINICNYIARNVDSNNNNNNDNIKLNGNRQKHEKKTSKWVISWSERKSFNDPDRCNKTSIYIYISTSLPAIGPFFAFFSLFLRIFVITLLIGSQWD